MDQQKVGKFLKELRSEKALTQGQLAEMLGVSNRGVSRWENGVTMPDFDLLIQMSKFYTVEIGEILDGERKGRSMDKHEEETLLKIAEYNNAEKESFAKRLHIVCVMGLVGIAVYVAINFSGLIDTQPAEAIANGVLGLVTGALITAVLCTSHYGAKLRAAKLRLWKRISQGWHSDEA